MKKRYPLQKFNKKTVAVVTISAAVAVYTGASIFKLVRVFRPKPDIITRKSGPLLEAPAVENSRVKLFMDTLCKTKNFCKSFEQIYGAMNSDDLHSAEKIYAKDKLKKVLNGSELLDMIERAGAFKNCMEQKLTCDCFDLLPKKICPD